MYGQNYAQLIENRLAGTTATPQSIEYLGEEVIRYIGEIDDQIVTALKQRRRIVTLMEPFFSLYQGVSGDALIETLPGLSQLEEDPTDLNAHDFSEAVLGLADEMWDERENEDDLLPVGGLELKLKGYAVEVDVKIPWSNPRAVISTILLRSERWERATARQYRRIDNPIIRF